MREMDLIMGRFADAAIGTIRAMRRLDDFERLIDVPDPDLYTWITGDDAMPPRTTTPPCCGGCGISIMRREGQS